MKCSEQQVGGTAKQRQAVIGHAAACRVDFQMALSSRCVGYAPACRVDVEVALSSRCYAPCGESIAVSPICKWQRRVGVQERALQHFRAN